MSPLPPGALAPPRQRARVARRVPALTWSQRSPGESLRAGKRCGDAPCPKLPGFQSSFSSDPFWNFPPPRPFWTPGGSGVQQLPGPSPLPLPAGCGSRPLSLWGHHPAHLLAVAPLGTERGPGLLSHPGRASRRAQGCPGHRKGPARGEPPRWHRSGADPQPPTRRRDRSLGEAPSKEEKRLWWLPGHRKRGHPAQ